MLSIIILYYSNTQWVSIIQNQSNVYTLQCCPVSCVEVCTLSSFKPSIHTSSFKFFSSHNKNLTLTPS